MNNRNQYNRRSNGPRRVEVAHSNVRRSGGLAQWLRPTRGTVDYMFIAIILMLLTYGIIMLYSAGSSRAFANFGDSLYYIKRQLMWAVVGGVGMWFAARVDYHMYGGKVAGFLYIACMMLLIMVISGLGTTVNGATRWLFGFQPSEVAKIAIIVLFSYKLSQPSGQKDLKHFKSGFLPYIFLFGMYALLLMLEPHFSCVILIFAVTVVLLFVAGAPFRYFVYIVILAGIAGVGLIVAAPYRMARVVSFLDPFSDMQGSGWQIVQSLYAIGSGGIFGVGLGKSRQKFLSLPEPQNDFIFSVLCEELGLIGAILLIALFILLLVRGIQIAAKAPDLFGMLLVTGIVGIVVLQALVNIAVVTSSIPVTGMPLPFFSYGGSALAITMTEMGIVLNVSRQTRLPI